MGYLLRTLKGEKIDRYPIWLMRQAGRYLPEYREIRQNHPDFLSLVYHSIHACEVTIQPLRRFDLDAAILFSDILVTPQALGQSVQFLKGEGPHLDSIKNKEQLSLNIDKDNLFSPIYETLKKIKQNPLMETRDLIGFAGSPWTVACYMIQGHGKTGFPKALSAWHDNKELLQAILNALVEVTKDYLEKQIKSGAQIIQLFDSWAGLIPKESEDLFIEAVLKPTLDIYQYIQETFPEIPVICFPRGLSKKRLIKYAQTIKPQGLSLSEDVDLGWAIDNFSPDITLQGNLSNELLLSGGNLMFEKAKEICETMKGRRFIFNLGHGIIKETPPEHVKQLVDFVHNFKI